MSHVRIFRAPLRAAILATACAFALNGTTPAGAFEPIETAASSVPVSAFDSTAGTRAETLGTHVLPARTRAGALAALQRRLAAAPASTTGITLNTLPSPAAGFYPAALSYFGGPVLKTATQHNAYVNATSGAPWGNPSIFLTNLNASTFVHLSDQYVASTANGRYPVGSAASVSGSFGHVVQVSTIYEIVHATAAALHASGTGHVIHVFLQKGVDTCVDSADTTCYSPDNPNSFVFCAYHSAVRFTDIGTVLYSVEPYQAVPGCGVDYGGISPANSELIDGTASVLSHELFETITDPIPLGARSGSGWVAASSFDELGYEIGDICQSSRGINSTLNGHPYTIQMEYSNHYQACTNSP